MLWPFRVVILVTDLNISGQHLYKGPLISLTQALPSMASATCRLCLDFRTEEKRAGAICSMFSPLSHRSVQKRVSVDTDQPIEPPICGGRKYADTVLSVDTDN